MSNFTITYDRSWVLKYAEDVQHQRYLLDSLERELHRLHYSATFEGQINIYSTIAIVEDLAASLRMTEEVLRQYQDNVENSITQFILQLSAIE